MVPFDLEEVLAHVQQHNMHQFQGAKDLVLLIGKTGHGKSTTINWLLGERIEEHSRQEIIDDFRQTARVLTCPTERKGIAIGHGQFTSETFFLQGYKDPDGPLVFCDSPGLGDTKGVNVAIAHATAITRILHRSTTVRVVLVLSANVFLRGTGRGDQIRQLLDEMQQFMNIENAEPGHQYDSLMVNSGVYLAMIKWVH